MIAAVSRAGGLGALGCHYRRPSRPRADRSPARDQQAVRAELPRVRYTRGQLRHGAGASPRGDAVRLARPDQDLKAYFDRSHEAGSKVTHMAGSVPEAGAPKTPAPTSSSRRAAKAAVTSASWPHAADPDGRRRGRAGPGAGGGRVCRGRGLVAALALGAQGILLGTRFLATVESPLHPNFKQAIIDSDGHDTQVSEIPDIASGLVWPGAMTRSRRNEFVERWSGREWALRQNRAEACEIAGRAETGDVDEGPLSMGQDAGLIHDIPPAGEIVARIAREADEILRKKLPGMLKN